MSSTKRGGQRSVADFYPTPKWCVDRLLDRMVLPAGRWLEAGAGDGAIIKAVNEHPNYGAKRIRWTAVELRPECAPVLEHLIGKPPIIGDFLTAPTPDVPFTVCIANPPFSLAESFLRVARQKADYVCFLLRLNFLQGSERAEWLVNDVPDVWLIPDRPSFTGDGQTDSVAYAWMVWSGYHRGKCKSSRFEILATTPSEVRNPASRKKRKKDEHG